LNHNSFVNKKIINLNNIVRRKKVLLYISVCYSVEADEVAGIKGTMEIFPH